MAAGDVTYSAKGSYFACGTVQCDADAAVNVICGFVPDKIVLHYKDDGGTANKQILWLKGMDTTDGVNVEYMAVADAGDVTFPTSGAPTLLAASASNSTGEGFTIPAGLMDADADVIYWEAHRAA